VRKTENRKIWKEEDIDRDKRDYKRERENSKIANMGVY